MKFVIAFAFLAAASAASVGHKLVPEPMAYDIPDFRPLFVPAEVMEAVRIAELNAIPKQDAEIPVIAIIVVDSPIEEPNADDGLAVKFVDFAVNAEETPVEIPVEAVKVVESFEDVVARDADAGLAVKFVDVADNTVETPVEIAEVVEAGNADAGLAVNFVDVAVNADEAPVEDVVTRDADAGLIVKFVDVADNAVDTPAEIAEEAVEAVENVVAGDADAGLAVKFVDIAENQEIPVENAIVGDAPLEVAEPVAKNEIVVDMPQRYPAKQYESPLLRSSK